MRKQNARARQASLLGLCFSLALLCFLPTKTIGIRSDSQGRGQMESVVENSSRRPATTGQLRCPVGSGRQEMALGTATAITLKMDLKSEQSLRM
jgi:hypothetical protein